MGGGDDLGQILTCLMLGDTALKYLVVTLAVVSGLASAGLWALSSRVEIPSANRPASTPGDVQRLINGIHKASTANFRAAGLAAISSILSALSSLL